jgi:hypothetical protein
MDNENIISNELLEILFSSMCNDNNFNDIIKYMYNFLKENTFSNNSIHTALLQFFGDRREYISDKFSINFNQIKVLLNQLILNSSENTNTNTNINHTISEILDSSAEDDHDNDEENADEDDTPDTEEANNLDEVNNVIEEPIPPQPTANYHHQPFNLFNMFLNTQVNHNAPLIFDPLYNPMLNPQYAFYGQQHYGQPNLFNLFNNMLPHQLETNDFFNITDVFLNEGTLSNSQINNLNNIIPNLGNIYSTIHTNLINGDFTGPFEINITIPSQQSTSNIPANVINESELEELKIVQHKDLINKDILNKDKYVECSICLSEYNEDSQIRLLKCDHGFHPECVDQWLKNYKYNCPVCRNEGHS